MQSAAVDTARVSNRRQVHLATLEDFAAEVDRIVAAAREGKVLPLGNWSPAQVLWHLARFIEFSIDGFPFRYLRGLSWITRLLRAVAWKWLIKLALRPGFANPPDAAALEPDTSVTLDDAASYLRQQLARIDRGERMTKACSSEGPYSHEQWIYINLRHAELHLSFLEIQAADG
jgi:hypothetical protein